MSLSIGTGFAPSVLSWWHSHSKWTHKTRKRTRLIAILSWMLLGLVIGALARLLVPGEQPMGLTKTMLLGVAGSFVGGFVAFLLVGGAPLQGAGWIGSIIGAVVLLAIAQRSSRSRAV